MLSSIYRRVIHPSLGRSVPAIVRSVRAESLTYLDDDALGDLYEAVRDIEAHRRTGILIEAGCGLGGSAIVIAAAKSPARPFFVHDVFGMIPAPSDNDSADVHERYRVIRSGQSVGIGGNKYYGYEEDLVAKVTESFRRHSVPIENNNIHLLKGLFQDTLRVREPVALAHVDGDWYDSVMTSLTRIEPYLAPHGVLVIDDYDAWSGCRKAVDEYFRDKRDRYDFIRKARLHIVPRHAGY
jgi:O-methyltransferase